MSARTVLIGLDGATFSILDPLMAQGVMPFLKAFLDSGARAPLRSTVPPLTPPAWTSLLTGRSPGHHGVFDFFQPQAPGSRQIRLTTSRDVRCEAIWHIANRQGRQTTVLNFPVTFPPPALDGYLIAGWMPWRQLRLGCHPPGLYDQLKSRPGFNARELAMDMALEAKATEGCREDEYTAWVELHLRREQHWLDVLRYLMRNHPTEFTAILFDGPDKVQHLCWRFLDPVLWPARPTRAEQAIRDVCLSYFRQLDGVLAEVVALAGDEATVIVASDHGFGATTKVFHLNTWLAHTGRLAWSDGAGLDTPRPGTLGMGDLARHTQWIDWDRTTAYASTPTSNGIHIVRAEGGGSGVPPAAYDAYRQELTAALYGVLDPASGEAVVSRVWTREEAFAGPAMTLAPDLTLGLRDGGLVSILPSDEPLKARPSPVGTHGPLGVFAMRGPGVRKGATLRELSLLEVAPTLLYSLGLSIPEDFEAQVPLELFEPSFRTRRPIRWAPRLASPPRRKAEAMITGETEAVIVARLRELGYLD